MIYFEDMTHLFSIDWVKIEEHVQELSNTLPRQGGEYFSGWSVQGKNGSFKDGWIDGSAFIKYSSDGTRSFDYATAKKAGLHPSKEHVKITDASCPALNDYVQQMVDLGFQPARSRLIDLRPGDRSNWHTDSSANVLTLRMHAVIRTNPQAMFVTEAGEQQLQAHHVYLINVNDYHQVQNDGDSSRTHLVTDVVDSRFLSKVHHTSNTNF